MRRDRGKRYGAGGNVIGCWTCECGKRGYKDRDAAKTVIQMMRRRGAERPETLNAYPCRLNTGCWHVGHRATRCTGVDLNDPRTWTGEAS